MLRCHIFIGGQHVGFFATTVLQIFSYYTSFSQSSLFANIIDPLHLCESHTKSMMNLPIQTYKNV
jgi:hypothetical protein